MNSAQPIRLIFYFITTFSALGWSLPTLQSILNTNEAPSKIEPTGKRETLEKQVNGVVDGLARYYHPNGQLYGVIEYKNGKKNGVHKLFREDGTLEQQLSYKNGVLEGVSRWYNEKEELTVQAEYVNGVAIETKKSRTKATPDPGHLKMDEEKLTELQKLAQSKADSDLLEALTKKTFQDYRLSAPVVKQAFLILQKWNAELNYSKTTTLVQLKIDFDNLIQQHEKIKSNPQGQLHVFTYYSDDDVYANQALIERIICEKNPTGNAKTWAYTVVKQGQSETQFEDQIQRVVCKK